MAVQSDVDEPEFFDEVLEDGVDDGVDEALGVVDAGLDDDDESEEPDDVDSAAGALGVVVALEDFDEPERLSVL